MKNLLNLLLFFISISALAQQRTDTLFLPEYYPEYIFKDKSLVLVDQVHFNAHTLEDRLVPFSRALKNHGLDVQALTSIQQLIDKNPAVFIIVNPLNPVNRNNWARPVLSAYTEREISLIANWVKEGGNLFLVADHMPYPGASNRLAKKFGLEFIDGFALGKEQTWPPQFFTREKGSFEEHPVLKDLDSIAAFTGSAIKMDSVDQCLIKLDDSYEVLVPDTAWQFSANTPRVEASNLCFDAIKQYGKGKIYIGSEAAMMTAQIIQNKFPAGMNSPYAKDNLKYLLRIFHWLLED